MSDWKEQIRYFAANGVVEKEYRGDSRTRPLMCTCGNTKCSSPGKHPKEYGWQQQATNDPEQVEKWCNDPKINLGIACGQASGIVVVDVDGQEGMDSLFQLAEESGDVLQPTYMVLTGREGGGWHRYYKCPSPSLPNGVKFRPGLDFRSDGGLVIAPGGKHISGKLYEVVNDVEPIELPQWLIQVILHPSKVKARKTKTTQKLLAGGLQPGSRNNTIFKLAASLHHAGAHIETATAACLAENQKAEQPLPEHEVMTAVKSAYGYPTDDRAPLDLSDQGLTDEFLATKPLLKYITDDQSWVGYLDGLWLSKETPADEIGKTLKRLEPSDIFDVKLAGKIHQRLYSKAAVQAVIFFAEAKPELGITASEFDPDPMLLGLPDGEVLDLRTGERRAATPYDLLTRTLPVAPIGTCPRWLEYLRQAHPNDEELISYLQRWAGYCLSAWTKEDMILFLIGIGGSGKGTFAEPLQKLLGGYCVSIPIGMLLESTNEDRRLNYIASLRGARLAVCNEGSKQQRLDSRGIKLLTGGGWLTGRRLGHQPINFKATHKIVVLANDNPVLELDDAMKQRVHVVPFNQKFRGEKTEEKGLREFFAEPEQLQGIFAWMLEGCLSYQKEGLNPPASVTTTTEQYFKDADLFEQFLLDETEEVPGSDVFLSTEAGWYRWSGWCQRQGYTDKLVVGTTKTFNESLKQKRPHLNFGRTYVGKDRVRGFAGIRLLVKQQELQNSGEYTL